ncbi:MAG: hypothetical protein AAF745_15635, partial [Planctomycetota bacterium]
MQESEIFLQAVEIVDPTERDQYIERLCDGDNSKIERVESLLRVYRAVDSEVTTPFPNAGRDLVARAGLPAGFLVDSDFDGSCGRLGEYEILSVVGVGGTSVVLKA